MADDEMPDLEDAANELMSEVSNAAGAGAGRAAPPSSSMMAAGALPPGVHPGQRIQVTMEELKKWTVVYPAYLNVTLTVQQGRRLPRSKCEGCFEPSIHDIGEACMRLGLLAVPINKRYPRSDFRSGGQLRVQLKDKEGNPLRAHVPTKEVLLEEIAKLIPSLEGRKARMAQFAAMKKQFEEMRAKGPRAGKVSEKKAKKEQKKAKQAAAKQQAVGQGSLLKG